MPLKGENNVVESLYDAAFGRLSWDEVGRNLVRTLDGLTLMLSVHSRRTPAVDVISTLGMSSEHLRLYSEHYARHDLWALGALPQRLFGKALMGSQVVEDRVLERSLIYNEFLRPEVNMHHLAGALVPLDGDQFAVVGIHRPRDGRPFEPDDIRRLAVLLPHLQRALEIRQRLGHGEAIQQSVTAAFDCLSFGVIFMSQTGKLLHVNAVADAILSAGDGLARIPEGIRAVVKRDDRRLQQLIAAAGKATKPTDVPGGHLRVARTSGQRPYAVMVTPVNPGRPGRAIVAFVTDPSAGIVSHAKVLEELFGFPPAEARLVLALLNGTALPDYARQSGLSYHTVRTLLARAMARTETRTQLELVLLVARAVAGMSTRPPGRE